MTLGRMARNARAQALDEPPGVLHPVGAAIAWPSIPEPVDLGCRPSGMRHRRWHLVPMPELTMLDLPQRQEFARLNSRARRLDGLDCPHVKDSTRS